MTLESTQSTGFTQTTSLVITKPVSLAVGDTLVACLYGKSNAAPNAFSLPGGWTSVENFTQNVSGSACAMAIFRKVADSSDVAASNFTFTLTGADYLTGSLSRVSGFGEVDGNFSTSANGPASPLVVASGIDPDLVDNLIFFVVGAGENVTPGSQVAITSVSIATNNPTWTSRATHNLGVANNTRGFNVQTAVRTQASAFGNASVSFTGPANTDVMFALVSIAPQVNGSHSVVTPIHNFINQPFLRTGSITVDGETPDVTSMNHTPWVNETKPTTTWTNEQL